MLFLCCSSCFCVHVPALYKLYISFHWTVIHNRALTLILRTGDSSRMWQSSGAPQYHPLTDIPGHQPGHVAHASPNFSDYTASSSSPMLNEKNKYHDTTYTENPAYGKQGTYADYGTGSYSTNRRTIESLQRWNNILGYALGIFSVGLTLVMEGIMVYVLVKFYQTKDIPAPDRTSPWAKDTTLWPTLVLLVASLLTFLVEVASMIAACCRKTKVEDKITWLGRTVKVAQWVAVFILYRIGKTSRDLWGWSCDDRAAAIQQFYVTDLDFHALCTEQVSRPRSVDGQNWS